MAKEMKIAHDYFLDCCKKYGFEIVSDRKVRSHYETVIKLDDYETTEKSLSAYGQGKEKKIGMTVFRTVMAGYYIHKNDPDKASYWLHELRGKDILKEEKAKESDLLKIYKLIDKALTIANKSTESEVPDEILNAVSDTLGKVYPYLKTRGEL